MPQRVEESLPLLQKMLQWLDRRQEKDRRVTQCRRFQKKQIAEVKEVLRQMELEKGEIDVYSEKAVRIRLQFYFVVETTYYVHLQSLQKLKCHLDLMLLHIVSENEATRSLRDVIQACANHVTSMYPQINDMGENYRLSRGCVISKELTNVQLQQNRDEGTSLTMMVHFCDGETVPVDEDKYCIICLTDYQDGDDVFRNANEQLPGAPIICNHFFHEKCISKWIKRNEGSSCPCCREQFLINSTFYSD
jgi:Ring finger domain